MPVLMFSPWLVWSSRTAANWCHVIWRLCARIPHYNSHYSPPSNSSFILLVEYRKKDRKWAHKPVPVAARSRSGTARLLRSWVRIPPRACMFVVTVMCCQVEVCATSWSLAQRSPTDCDASLCVIYKSCKWGGHGPRWAAAPRGV